MCCHQCANLKFRLSCSSLLAMRLPVLCLSVFLFLAFVNGSSYPTLLQFLVDSGLGDHAESLAEKGFTVETLSKAAKSMPDATLRLLQAAGLRDGEALKVIRFSVTSFGKLM